MQIQSIYASIAGPDLNRIIVTGAGELRLIEATPDKFNHLASAQILRAGHRSFPAFSNGVLYARDGRDLVAVDLKAK